MRDVDVSNFYEQSNLRQTLFHILTPASLAFADLLSQQCPNPSLKFIDQFRVHKLVLVRNIKNVNRLVLKQPSEIFYKPSLVLFLHHEDQIRPLYICSADSLARIRTGTGRPGTETRSLAPQMLGRRAAPLISAANK